jgi:transposase
MAWRAVTNKQWKHIKQHLSPRQCSRKGGRPPLDDRTCFEGILWILWTGAPWSELPARYGSKSAVHHRLKAWALKAECYSICGACSLTNSLTSRRCAGMSALSTACSSAQKKGCAGRED